jgi:hypothetical protein
MKAKAKQPAEKGGKGSYDEPLDDPVAEKLRQQRCVVRVALGIGPWHMFPMIFMSASIIVFKRQPCGTAVWVCMAEQAGGRGRLCGSEGPLWDRQKP